VTAMNEEGNLEPTIESVVGAVGPRFNNYEIIIVDDGSQDRTFAIAERLAARNPRIRLQRNPRNMGLSYSYRKGIALATNEYTSWVAGNNIVPRDGLERIYDRIGERDMVISYVIRDVRGVMRRLVSRSFTVGMNLLFGLQLRYYTGPNVYRTAVAKQLKYTTRGSMFVPELLIRLLRSGQSYVEVGLQPLPRSSGATKTFRIRNVVDVTRSALGLFWELRVARKVTTPDSLVTDAEGVFSPAWSGAKSVGDELQKS
jgi:glycosyltransferase involved in cell wall biosynthesis